MAEQNVRTTLPLTGSLGGATAVVLFIVALAAFVIQSTFTQVDHIQTLCMLQRPDAILVCPKRSRVPPALLPHVCVALLL